ncbi:hypothetical protein CLI75_12590, partial [Porphyromonas gingivalis]
SGAELRLKHRYSLCEECHDPHHIHVFPILFAVADLLLHPTDDQHDKGGQAYEEYGELLSHKRCGFGTKIRVPSYIKCFFDR